jgi:hypothetical protein
MHNVIIVYFLYYGSGKLLTFDSGKNWYPHMFDTRSILWALPWTPAPSSRVPGSFPLHFVWDLRNSKWHGCGFSPTAVISDVSHNSINVFRAVSNRRCHLAHCHDFGPWLEPQIWFNTGLVICCDLVGVRWRRAEFHVPALFPPGKYIAWFCWIGMVTPGASMETPVGYRLSVIQLRALLGSGVHNAATILQPLAHCVVGFPHVPPACCPFMRGCAFLAREAGAPHVRGIDAMRAAAPAVQLGCISWFYWSRLSLRYWD